MQEKSNAKNIGNINNETKINFEDMTLHKIHIKVGIGGIGGQFCDGFILGIIGITMALAQNELHLDSYWLGLIGAASLLGLFLGSLFTGAIADKIGRRPIFLWTMPIFFIISIFQFFVHSPLELFILRFFLGLALGADYVAGISLVSELTPKKYRGKLLSLMMVGWVAGYSISYVVGFFMQDFGEGAWRYILLSSCVPAFIFAFFRLNIPASPLWLIKNGRIQKAQEMIEKYFGKNISLPSIESSNVEVSVNNNSKESSQSPESRKSKQISQSRHSYLDLFKSHQLKNTATGVVFYGAQVIPYFAISTFIPIVLEKLKVQDPYLGGVVYNLFLFIGVILGFLIINKISRKVFVVGSFYILALILVFLAGFTSMPSVLIIVLISIFSCVLAGAGVLEFAYTPELFPVNLRASGVGFVVASSRIFGALGTFLLPIITQNYSLSLALWLIVVVLIFAGIFCHIFAPKITH